MKTLVLIFLCTLVCFSVDKVKSFGIDDDEKFYSVDETCNEKECVVFSSIMDSLIDPSKSSCVNFFNFACGKFVKSTIVHDRYGEQGFSTALTEKAEEKIKQILESKKSEIDLEIRPFQLVKKTYEMCTNHDQLDQVGSKPLKQLIEELGSWSLISKGLNTPERSWQEMYERTLAKGFIADTFMSIYLATDPNNPSNYIVKITPPSVEDFNRGYYDLLPKGLENNLVNIYYTYMKEFTVLVGADEADAEREMLEVLKLEQKMFEIAKQKDPKRRPEPKLIKLTDLQEKFPFVQWKKFIEIYLGSSFTLREYDNVTMLDDFYFQNLGELVKNLNTRVAENYFFWRVLDYSKFYLSVALKQPALKLHEALYGRQTYEQQWKRCVSQLKSLFGMAITAMTARNDNEQNRVDTMKIIENVKNHVIETMKQVEMKSSVKDSLISTISSIELFVGYADEFFLDKPLEEFYRDLEIFDGEFFRTAINLEIFSMKTYGRRILKPISETRWETFTGNSFQKSFYSSIKKTIFIHPNDLKNPIYNADLPSYVNYARLGWQVANLYAIAISFELDGKNVTWYDDISNNIRSQYQDYVTKTYNMTVDGSKSIRINFADYLSYQFAYKAVKFDMENLIQKPLRLPGLHYSLEQFFWISAMQRYCHVNKDQETLQKLILSNFPIESFRANNPLFNNPEFQSDFGCPQVEKEDKNRNVRSSGRSNSEFNYFMLVVFVVSSLLVRKNC